jgi:hypothetical protein
MRHTFAALRQNRRPSPAESQPASAAMLMNKLIRTPGRHMTKELIERSRQRHAFADLALVVTVALAVSLVIAATVVSIGIARADTLGPIGESDGRFTLAVVLGLVIAGVGGLTALLVRGHTSPLRRDQA